jgi:hypothetical protein
LWGFFSGTLQYIKFTYDCAVLKIEQWLCLTIVFILFISITLILAGLLEILQYCILIPILTEKNSSVRYSKFRFNFENGFISNHIEISILLWKFSIWNCSAALVNIFRTMFNFSYFTDSDKSILYCVVHLFLFFNIFIKLQC